MQEYYTLEVAGLTRKLPILPVDDKLSIAGFVMFSDVELTVACATELLKKTPEFDAILTAEAKGIPLAYEMSRQTGKKYILARKFPKLYMINPIEVKVKSITTAFEQKLIIDSHDAEFLKDKRILLVDDVISTGGSVEGLEELVHTFDGNVVGKAFVLAEGDATKREDIIFLEELPLFFK